MLVKDIKSITLEDAYKLAKKGLFFIVRDGEIKGMTKK